MHHYVETHFPENISLFNKLQDKIIKNIEQTDPKNFTGHKEAPKFSDDDIEMSEQRKQIALKHFKKPVFKGSENRWSIYTLELQKVNVIFRE